MRPDTPPKISKPAASSMPLKNSLCILASEVLLILTTSHLNILLYMVLPRALMEFWHWSMFWPFCTNSSLTLTCSLVMPFRSSLKLGRPMRWATLLATEQERKSRGVVVPCPGEPQPLSIVFREGVMGREGRLPACMRKLGPEAAPERYTMEYYAAMKNENLPSVAVWEDWKVIMVCEISQTAKDHLYVKSNISN